ncbi:MAG: tetratricopeptide repeat protein [Bacteroidales bacterium]|nr:tetratricopeptide repeat protein [Bacteroidales bacterium]MDD4821290.1 tetratricopeptide repeat protein [Bacteroidales bacterium]
MNKFLLFSLTTLLILNVSACKVVQKSPGKATQSSNSSSQLSDPDNRKFDYIFEEALRLKNGGDDDAAFQLFSYCYSLDSMNAPVMFELSTYFAGFSDYEKAKSLMIKAVRLDEENKWYKWGLAKICLEQGDTETGIPILETLISQTEDNQGLMETLSDLYVQTKQYDKAIKLLDKLENRLGPNEELTINKFHLYLLNKQEKKAFNEIAKLQQLYPQDIHNKVLEGDLYLSINKLDKAYEIYQQVAIADSTNADLAISMVQYKGMKGEPVEEVLKKAIFNEEVDCPVKLEMLSNYYTATNVKKEVQASLTDSLFQYMVNKYPLEPDVKLAYSDLLVREGKMKESADQIENVVELIPDNQKAWQLLINYYLKEQNTRKLIEITEKAVSYLPDNSLFWFYLCASYSQNNETDKALKACDKGISLAEKDGKSAFLLSEFYGLKGDIYQGEKKEQEAINAYEKALKYNDQNINVLNNYAYYLSNLKKDLTKAEWMSGRCIALQPENPTYLDTYAWIYFVQGNYSLALFYIERAFNKGIENNAEVLEHYGDILFLNDQKEKAVLQWEKALEHGSKSELIKEKISTQTYIE